VPPSPPLGTQSFPQYEETRTALGPGDGILLYSDGLIERRGVGLTENLARLRRVVETGSADSAAELCDRVIGAFATGAVNDDLALLAVRMEPITPRLRFELSADPNALAGARHALRRWLRGQGADEEGVRVITLAAGEACANAIEHAYGPGAGSFELEALREDAAVCLTVRDHGDWRECRGAHRGRGLELISATMEDVHIERGRSGTEVVMHRRLSG
jgi:anti-sigma regulatory factor (Ser/Thr protein kinase)